MDSYTGVNVRGWQSFQIYNLCSMRCINACKSVFCVSRFASGISRRDPF